MKVKYFDICDKPFKIVGSTLFPEAIFVLEPTEDKKSVVEREATDAEWARYGRNFLDSGVLSEREAKCLALDPSGLSWNTDEELARKKGKL